jgi:hypothetical protein
MGVMFGMGRSFESSGIRIPVDEFSFNSVIFSILSIRNSGIRGNTAGKDGQRGARACWSL